MPLFQLAPMTTLSSKPLVFAGAKNSEALKNKFTYPRVRQVK